MRTIQLLIIGVLISAQTHTALADGYEIPALIGQTGASSTFGKAELDGYTLAIEEWNGRYGGIKGSPVRLKVEDTLTDQRTTITAFHNLSAQGFKVILGPTWLDGLQGVIPLAERKDVLLVAPSAEYEAFEPKNRWPVTFYYSSRVEAEALCDYLPSHGIKNVVVLYEREPFAELMNKLVTEESKGRLEVVEQIGVAAGESNFRSILPKLSTKNIDGYIVLVWDERSLLTLLKDLRTFAPQKPIITIHDGEGWLSKSDFKAAIARMIYSRFEVADSSFRDRFRKRFGYDVQLTGSNAYDAAWSVLEALRSGASDARAIRSYLTAKPLKTATFGEVSMPEGHIASSKVDVLEYRAP